MINAKKVFFVSFFLLLILVLFLFLALCLGTVNYNLGEVVTILVAKIFGISKIGDNTSALIVYSLRLPRVLLAILVGGALASSGCIFQSLLKNPLADPYILGVSSGAALGAVISITLSASFNWGTPFFALVGGVVTIFLVIGLGYRGLRASNNHSLLLTGVVVSFFLSSLVMFFVSISSNNELSSIIFWLMGNLAGASFSKAMILFFYIFIMVILLYFEAKNVNALALGEEEALSLGVEVEKVKRRLYLFSSALTAVTVAIVGTIGFVGLVVPHLARLLFGGDNRIIIPSSFLIGGAFLLIADTLARTIISPHELPVGVVTAFIGAPFFLYLLKWKRV